MNLSESWIQTGNYLCKNELLLLTLQILIWKTYDQKLGAYKNVEFFLYYLAFISWRGKKMKGHTEIESMAERILIFAHNW